MLPSCAVSSPDRLRVIVADDHEWIRDILVQIVRQTLPAAEIVSTEDGVQALAAYLQGGCDFMVSNHTMPNLDGAGLIRKLREQDAELPILMVSIHPEAASDAMAAGANWFLSKDQIMERMPGLLLRFAGRGAKCKV